MYYFLAPKLIKWLTPSCFLSCLLCCASFLLLSSRWFTEASIRFILSFVNLINASAEYMITFCNVFTPLKLRIKYYVTSKYNYVIMHLPWRNWLGSINYISFKFVAIFSAFIFPIALTINHILNSIKFFFVFHYFFDSFLFQNFFVSKII